MSDALNDLEYKKFGQTGSHKPVLTIQPAEQIKIDKVDADNRYIGKAAHSVAASAELWQIKKISTSGTVTTISYADGVETYTKEWDERASYSY